MLVGASQLSLDLRRVALPRQSGDVKQTGRMQLPPIRVPWPRVVGAKSTNAVRQVAFVDHGPLRCGSLLEGLWVTLLHKLLELVVS